MPIGNIYSLTHAVSVIHLLNLIKLTYTGIELSKKREVHGQD